MPPELKAVYLIIVPLVFITALIGLRRAGTSRIG